ncbi:MAG: hypothetical protein QOD83_1617 [Solirubrobacteraceae bacterium]|nr:hypothetical protein [Solirubrobacteraceae bacterium]
MSTTQSAVGGVAGMAARPPRRIETAAVEVDCDTITTLTRALAEAERRAVVAEDDLAYLASDTGRSLQAARADADARVTAMHEHAAAAIRLAEQRASAALRGARESVRQAQVDAEARWQLAMQAQLDLRIKAEALACKLGSELEYLRREFEAERKLADDAARWASRVEGELLHGTPATADAVAGTSPIDPPNSTPARREPRVRVRHAS